MPNPYKYGSIEFDNWNYEHPDEARYSTDAVTLAKDSLGRANAFADETGSADIAALEDRLAKLRLPEDKRGLLRKITEPLSNAGQIAQGAALPAGFVNPVIGGALGTGGTLAILPDMARRYLAPEEGEEGPGMLEAGLTAASLVPSVRGLKALTTKAPAVLGPLGDLEGAAGIGGRALAYEGSPVVARGARPAMLGSQKAAVDALMESPSFANLPRSTGEMLPVHGPKTFADAVREASDTLRPHLIPEQGAQTFADAVRETAAHPRLANIARNSDLDAVAANFGRGPAATGYSAEAELSKPGSLAYLKRESAANKGIADYVFGKDLDLLGRPKSATEARVASGVLKRNGTPLEIPTADELSPAEVLKARAKERFKKSYRRE